MGDETTRLVVVRIGDAVGAEEVWRMMEAVVEGRLVEVGKLDEGVKWSRVDKVSTALELVWRGAGSGERWRAEVGCERSVGRGRAAGHALEVCKG